MGITIGIDIGGSTTKIVGIRYGEILAPLMVRANDPIASLFGAFGKFIDANSLALGDVEKVAVTGVGASSMDKPIYGIPTFRVEEFLANGLGGLYLSKLDEAVIVSMGTGTAFVRADGNGIHHLGGSGVGGGTLLGLSGLMLNIRNIDILIDTAKDGDLGKVDLTIGDISKNQIGNMPEYITASNFGKLSDLADKADIALAIINLVFQTIGMLAVFASREFGQKEAVLIGNLSRIPYCRTIFNGLELLHGFKFVIPEHSEHATAVGAALAVINGRECVRL